MLMNLLTNSVLPEGYREVSVGTASLYALIGYLVVFAGIALLIFIVWLVGQLITKTNGKTVIKEKAEPKKIEETVATTPVQSEDDDEIDDETIVLITAALMAYYEKNNPQCEFTLKRIKRIRRNNNA